MTKILPITNDDLYRVLAGRTMTVSTKDGESIALRLYTPDELLQLHEKLTTEAGEPASLTREKAEDLTRPHDLWALLEQLKQQNRI